MRKTLESMPDFSKEVEKRRKLEVATINTYRLKTIEELRQKIESITSRESLNAVITTEFSFEVGYVIEHLEEFRGLAEEINADLVLAPETFRGQGERPLRWKDIKAFLVTKGAVIEENKYPDDLAPSSVGIFISKKGDVFVFPKHEFGVPVHRIPGTDIGITICGEINHIKPEQLEGIRVLYNPAEEHDDLIVRFRMAQEAKGKPLIREEVERLALQDEEMRVCLLDEEAYEEHVRKSNESLRRDIGDEKFEELFGDLPLVGPDETVESRREYFNRQIEKLIELLSGDYDSLYVKQAPGLADALRKNKIVVIRADGMGNSGLLNKFEGVNITGLDIRPEATRLSLSV